MTVSIINGFKVIDIGDKECEGFMSTGSASDGFVEFLLEGTVVRETGEAVGGGHGFHIFEELSVLQGGSEERGEKGKEFAFIFGEEARSGGGDYDGTDGGRMRREGEYIERFDVLYRMFFGKDMSELGPDMTAIREGMQVFNDHGDKFRVIGKGEGGPGLVLCEAVICEKNRVLIILLVEKSNGKEIERGNGVYRVLSHNA